MSVRLQDAGIYGPSGVTSSPPELFLGTGIVKICSKIYRRTLLNRCLARVLFFKFAAYFQKTFL